MNVYKNTPKITVTKACIFIINIILISISTNIAQSNPIIRQHFKAIKNSKKIIVIDPGHGGIDSGAVSKNNIQEKDITLQVAMILNSKLAKSNNYEVYLTRNIDKYVSLRKRFNFVKKLKADLLISLHADKLSSKSFYGLTVYTLSDKASSDQAKKLAKRENLEIFLDKKSKTSIIKNTNKQVNFALASLMEKETVIFSNIFAKILLENIKDKYIFSKNPHRKANFFILRNYTTPSILIELGFMSNQNNLKELQSKEWINKRCDEIISAIYLYFNKK